MQCFLAQKLNGKNNHNPMPAIAIIGNDGSGKTTVVNYIRKNFSKMDPLIIDMKGNKPFFSLVF
jgi:ABC-type branched-subunit amino acid transport system ATPase component